jgi:exonuclease SbcD
MGHLTVLGATTSDSERDIHIGNLGSVGADVFDGFDYTALGHLHRPQRSPATKPSSTAAHPSPSAFPKPPMRNPSSSSTHEAGGNTAEIGRPQSSESKNSSLRFSNLCGVTVLPIPLTHSAHPRQGARATLAADLENVPAGAWAEVTVKLDAPEPDLDRQVREAAAGRFEVLKVLADLPISETARPGKPKPPPSTTSSPATSSANSSAKSRSRAMNSAPCLMS